MVEASEFLNRKLVSMTYQSFVDSLHRNLPHPVLRTTVHDSVKNLLKKNLTPELLHDVAWRLAGNLGRLSDQQAVPEWNGQYALEWVPAQICDVRATNRLGKTVNLITFQSLSGTIVPHKLTQTWSIKKTKYLAVYRNAQGFGFGFNRSKINSRGEQQNSGMYRNSIQFYGARCFLLLDPKMSKLEPFIMEVGHSGASTLYNKRLIKGRDRTQTPCLKGLPSSLECYACPYGIDRCVLATHEATYQKGSCPRCSRLGFFDPLEIEYSNLCLNCVQEESKS